MPHFYNYTLPTKPYCKRFAVRFFINYFYFSPYTDKPYRRVGIKLIVMIFSHSLLAIFLAMPGGAEWIFILLAVVLLFGGKKIPELMKGIGKGVRDFNDAKDSVKKDIEEGMKPKPVAEVTTNATI